MDMDIQDASVICAMEQIDLEVMKQLYEEADAFDVEITYRDGNGDVIYVGEEFLENVYLEIVGCYDDICEFYKFNKDSFNIRWLQRIDLAA